MEPLVRLEHVSYGYEEDAVLEDVSLTIGAKDFILLIGPNGGGKSTLLKLIVGILKPRSGAITYGPGVEGRLGYVPQFALFNRNFPISVFDMVLMGCADASNYLSRYTSHQKDKTSKILKDLGLYEYRRRLITELSGGQLQRVLIGRALVSDPCGLFLDEPTTAMDMPSQGYLLDLLAELQERMSILVVTHDPTPYASSYRHLACLNRRLYFHSRGELDLLTLEKVYGCPVELLGHGIPHKLLAAHDQKEGR